MRSCLALVAAALIVPVARADFPPPQEDKDKPGLLELFEDDDASLLSGLTETNNDNAVARRETRDVYSGQRSLCVTPVQRFNPRMPGWNFPIVEKPGPGQYRYLRFAWKKVDGKGVMIQLCSGNDWNHRYVAGANTVGWQPFVTVAVKPPTSWKLVTRDLYKDFGAMTLNGIAFAAMDGTCALFDHIYLARSPDDFNRIDAIGRDAETIKEDLPAARLKTLWDNLAEDDDARALRTQRTLFAAAKQAAPFLRERLRPLDLGPQEKQILDWIKALDDDDFDVREKATDNLANAGRSAYRALRRAGEATGSTDVKHRIDSLLKGAVDDPPSAEEMRMLRAIQVLERIGTPEAVEVLKTLAGGTAGADPTEAARAAVERLSRK